jgi:hypothetical protein
MNATLTPAPVYPRAWALLPVPLWLAAWIVSMACGSSCTSGDGRHSFLIVPPADPSIEPALSPSAVPVVVIDVGVATGIGSSFTTSATSGLAARRSASPGDTVADSALMT